MSNTSKGTLKMRYINYFYSEWGLLSDADLQFHAVELYIDAT